MPGLGVGATVAGCRIEAVAGHGGMGVVYRATQIALDRTVALKVIAESLAEDESFRHRFKGEATMAASIEHPNVIPVYEAGERDGVLYIVMRFVTGTDLRAVIAADRRGLGPERTGALLGQVAEALAAAHRRGLVHRDVKPANVLIADEGGRDHVYLTDFGIARHVDSVKGVTRTGTVVGTVDYLAPERIEGERGDASSDVYALGCMLYEALTGNIPYPGETDIAKIYSHLNAELPSLEAADVPAELNAILARSLAKRPEDRYQSAGEFAAALEDAVRAGAVTEPLGRGEPSMVAEPAEVAEPPPPEPAPTVPPPPPPAETPPPAAEPPARESPEAAAAPPARGRLPRRALAAAGIAAGLAVLAVVAVLVLGGSDDGAGAEPEAGDPILVGSRPDGLSLGRGLVWVANGPDGTVTRIDAKTREVVGRPARVGADPDTPVVIGDTVWVSNTGDGTVSRLDADSLEPRGPAVAVGRKPEGMAGTGDALWVAVAGDDAIRRIETATGEVGRRIPVGAEPYDVAIGAGAVWATSAGDGTLARVDFRTGAIQRSRVGPNPRGLDVGEGAVWVTLSEGNEVVRVDPRTREVTDRIRVGSRPFGITAAAGEVWVTNRGAGTAMQIDPEKREVTATISVGSEPIGVAIGDGVVWVASFGSDSVTPIEL